MGKINLVGQQQNAFLTFPGKINQINIKLRHGNMFLMARHGGQRCHGASSLSLCYRNLGQGLGVSDWLTQVTRRLITLPPSWSTQFTRKESRVSRHVL